MKYSEWNQLDNAFKEKLFEAYHAWCFIERTPDSAEIGKMMLDKKMQEAYSIRQSYINNVTFSEG